MPTTKFAKVVMTNKMKLLSKHIASTNTLFHFYKNIEAEISVIFCVEGL